MKYTVNATTLAVLLCLASTAATPATADEDDPEVTTESTGQLESSGPVHRDRAITGGDYRHLAPETPGADIDRPQAPVPAAQQEQDRETRGLSTPDIDDRSFRRMREEMREKVPAHTPEWSDHNERDRGRADAQGDEPRFGDGQPGRRLPSGGENLRPGYRSGAGGMQPPRARRLPVPVIDAPEGKTDESEESESEDED